MQPTGAQQRTGAIIGVQALRALAAGMVAFHHFQHEASLLSERRGQAYVANDWLPWTAGVDIFFVISGFIMVHASANLFGTKGAAGTFLFRRVTRLVPLYWLATTAFLLVSAILPASLNSAPPGVLRIVASYLFVPMTAPDGNVVPVYSLGWTLNCEMFFYVIFALFIGFGRGMAVAGVAGTLIGLAILGAVFEPQIAPLRLWSQPIMLDFVAGMLIGVAHGRGVRLALPASLLLVLAGLAVLHLETRFLVPTTSLQAALVQGLPAVQMVAGAGLARPAGRPSALSRLLLLLGDASYAIYLLHPFVARLASRLMSAFALNVGIPVFVVSAAAMTLLVALAVHALFERPLMLRLRRGASWPTGSNSLV